jgi:hypothetical protein
MKVVGLFSGIGGFELGFQRAGFEVVSVCEIDPSCQKVLAARFPNAKLNADIRSCSLADFHAKTSLSLAEVRDSEEIGVGYGPNSDELLRRLDQTGLSSKMSAIRGGVGCPQCAQTLRPFYIPACRFECEPLTWERPMNVPASSLLPTPTASSYGSCRGGGAGRVGKWRKSLDGLGIKNPEYREWMMGYPIGWTEIERSETPSSPRSRRSLRKGSRRCPHEEQDDGICLRCGKVPR